ncbi:MAG: restriction endonuclease [Rikenellaceae bacterium]
MNSAYSIKECSQINKDTTDKLQELKFVKGELIRIKNNFDNESKHVVNAIFKMKQEATKGQPWLASVFADFEYLQDQKKADSLRSKPHPALSASEQVKAIAKEKKVLIQELKEYKYKLQYYESLFPDLEDVCEGIAKNENEDDQTRDKVSDFVTKEEYMSMSTTVRNQLALDRYLKKHHTKSHIGKMYERYIGWMFESKGYKVEYCGIKNGLNDLGRDLICIGQGKVYVVQCKYWSDKKKLHENVICQLFGTAVKLKIDVRKSGSILFNDYSLGDMRIIPCLISNIDISDTAKEFTKELNVTYMRIAFDKNYPIIKCNIGMKGERIYHLPFDQQYDRVMIDKKGECYATTVKEAESKGFRRAKRWLD